MTEPVDVLLIGGGVMSATLGTFISQLEPDWTIEVYERLGDVALESSNAWNNAGTGHAALCELNYMPAAADGSVDPAKAISINEQFQLSRQFWASLVERGILDEPSTFINSTPHMTFVRGEKDVAYLKRRYEALLGPRRQKENEALKERLLSTGPQKAPPPKVLSARTPN